MSFKRAQPQIPACTDYRLGFNPFITNSFRIPTVETTRKFDKRAFASIGLFVTSLFLPVSMLLRHSPILDRLEHSQQLFTAIHSASGIVFVFFFSLHLIFNWKVLKKYLSGGGSSLLRSEVFASAVFVLFVIALFSTWDYLVQ